MGIVKEIVLKNEIKIEQDQVNNADSAIIFLINHW